jgi:hypothetical protein
VIIASHQPDLLPYSGVFHKMAKADVFDLKIYDQFVERGYQRRVKMREQWASLSVHVPPNRPPIVDIAIDPVATPARLQDFVVGRYRKARFYKERAPELLDAISDLSGTTDRLWQFNMMLLLRVRDMLGISTPVSIAVPTVGGGSVGLVSVLERYRRSDPTRPLTYLSGTGAKVYMGDCREFTDVGIDVVFSEHEPVTGDSIVTVLMDHEDPLAVVLAEHDTTLEKEHIA